MPGTFLLSPLTASRPTLSDSSASTGTATGPTMRCVSASARLVVCTGSSRLRRQRGRTPWLASFRTESRLRLEHGAQRNPCNPLALEEDVEPVEPSLVGG